MRAIWSGEITFGLVNVPVKLYSATRSHDLSFHQVHDEDHGRIRYQRHCEVCGREVDYEHIDKAYDDGDKTVVLTDEELEALPAEDNNEIDVVQFVPSEQVDPILLGTSYFLEPVGRSSKAYVLLRRTLEDTERTAIVTFTLRTKTRLGVLRVHEDLLALQTLRWPTDLREVDFGPSKSKISSRELEMSASLVEQFSGDFEPEKFTDEYQEQLRELVDAKLEQGDSVDTDETFGKERDAQDSGEGGKVVSLMDALERSLQKRRGADDGSAKSSGSSAKSGSRSGGSKGGSKGTSSKKQDGKSSKKSSTSTGSTKRSTKKSA
jgi:DNA end-binding protein Ku